MSQSPSKLVSLFEAAVELAHGEERARFLERECPDAGLRREVEALLAAHDAPDSLFEQRTVGVEAPSAEAVGATIGRYKLLQRIGEGGMGVVYMAEQEEPIRRRVALKIIKLGMDTRQVVARFEAERQALALMDHPNIAQVFDGGATESGRPYFVMELVQGVPITKFCDKNKLSAKERIQLFIPICQAIQSAHQKGIIHRDIKPSNVLITLHHGEPMPKVIDFGIAKATNQKLTEKTLFTNYATMLGTPAYMSPEQAEMSSLDVDTRTDVYSLGVLLYELLSGSTPFPEKRLLSLGYGEMQKVIAEEEPPRLSTRLSTMQDEEKTIIAKNRGIDPSALASLCKGDLDWIVMKCLEKDRRRRYDTPNELVTDLKRHLSHEPVSAAAPSLSYQLGKLYRRHRPVFVGAGAVAATLVLGLVAASWQAVRATKAERREVFERKKAEESGARESQQRALADANARKATESEQSARRLLYAADMRLAHQAWEDGNLSRMVNLLEAHRPKSGEADTRGFEYFYLQAKGEQQHILQRYTNAVLAMSISPDGKWLASRSDTEVWLWNLAERKAVARWLFLLTDEIGPAISFSHDSQFFSVVTHAGLQCFNVANPNASSFSKREAATAFFSPTTNWIAFTVTNGAPGELKSHTNHVWDYAANRHIAELAPSEILIGWSPDGNQLLTGLWNNRVVLWNALTWKSVETNFFRAGVSAAALSSDGRLMAAADWQGEIHLHEIGSGMKIGTIPSGDVRASALTFSPDGEMLATGSRDQVIQLWEVETQRLIRRLRGHHGKVTALAYTRDGQTLISAGVDGAVMLWNATRQPGESHIPNQIGGFGMPPQFSPDGKWMGLLTNQFSLGYGKWIQTGISSLRHSSSLSVAASPAGEILSFSPDSTLFAVLAYQRGAELQVWSVGALSNRATVYLDRTVQDRYNSLLSTDGTTLVYRTASSTIEVFEAASGEHIASLKSEPPAAVCFLPDGTLAYVDAVDKRAIKLWDSRSKKAGRYLKTSARIWCLAISPDAKVLAASYDDYSISLWDLEAGVEREKLTGHQGLTFALAFSADGRTLASGSEDRTIKFWHLATGREVASLSQDRAVYWLSFSPDNQMLISGGVGAFQVWRAPRGEAGMATLSPKLSLADLPTNSIWRLPEGPQTLPRRTAAERDQCVTNLLKIYSAIMAYRKDHQQMPDWLADLLPAYLSETNCLICPVHSRTGQKPDLWGEEDPNVTSSYAYEFNANLKVSTDPFGVAAPGDTMKTWKTKQLARYGEIVPVVRCWLHPRVLSVTFAGEPMETEDRWEDAAERKLREKQKAQPSAAAAPRK